MSDVAAAHNRTKNALSRALDDGMLSGQAFETASQLIADLRAPMRVVLFGLPQSGKSSVLNLLLGSEVIPEGLDLPTLVVRRGPRAHARLTLADGTVTEHPDFNLIDLADLDAVLFELQLNLPALAKISVMELDMGHSINGQGRAIAWGAKQCDLALWCTQGFPEHEALLWSAAPEHLKDRSILLRTCLDELGNRSARINEMQRLEQQAGIDFSRVMGLSAAEAAAARGPDGAVDKGALRASGGMAVISAVLRHLEESQQPLIDRADVLLVKAGLADVPGYGVEDPVEAPGKAEADARGPWLLSEEENEPASIAEPPKPARRSPLFRPKPNPAPAAPAGVDLDDAVPAPRSRVAAAAPGQTKEGVEAAIGAMVKTAGPLVLTSPVAVPAGTPPAPAPATPAPAPQATAPAPQATASSNAALATAPLPEPEPEPASPPQPEPQPEVEAKAPLTLVPDAPEPITISEPLRVSLSGAVRRLRTAGASMMNQDPQEILEGSVETVEWLSDRFETQADDLPDALAPLRDQVDEAFDLVQLLQLEPADSAAVDAVAVLLQLKRGIESHLVH